VRQYGRALNYIPEELMTEAVCIAAAKQDANALDYVPKKLQSKAKAALKDGASKN
jgi:hypothetical protein